MDQDNREDLTSQNGAQSETHGIQNEQTSQTQMGQSEQPAQETQQSDGLYHFTYMKNQGDSRFDRHTQEQNPGYSKTQQDSQRQSYNGFQKNVNGMEAWYDSQRMNNNYQGQPGAGSVPGYQQRSGQTARTQDQQMGYQQSQNGMGGMPAGQSGQSRMNSTISGYTDHDTMNTAHKVKKNKKNSGKSAGKGGFAKKAGLLVASAAVFGLVAAAVFQGVRYGTDKLAGGSTGSAATTTEAAVSEASTESNAPQLKQAASSDTANTNSTVYDVASVAKKVMPSIVSITGTYVTTYNNWFDSYQQESTGAGSGIIIGKDDKYLYIATNYHVVKDSKSLSVTFVDDKSADATVKGYVENNDVAVATVDLSDIDSDTLDAISEIQVGSSDDLSVGDPCVAIGNALGYGQSVTVGYISALDREVSASDETVKVLQTDAAINPGNSGGALVNMKGELIGINTAKYSDTSVEGMGYALPISDIQDIINDLIAGKNTADSGTSAGQAYLGISAQTITSQYSQLLNMPEGVYVSSVEQGSAAEECGLQSGDIICSLDGEDIADMDTFHDKIVACNPGDKVTIVYYRNNNGNYEKQTATATLKEKQ